MLLPEGAKDALSRLFRRQPIADLDALCEVLQTTSRMTVFRRLLSLGYVTSYSHNGRFYTLAEIPDYDADGLWRYQGVCFSRHGTLRDTVRQLVHLSEAGRTHPELAARLQVRVHNTLLDLVQHKGIGREAWGALYLYVSADENTSAKQLARRRKLEAAGTVAPTPVLRRDLIVEVLLEVVQGAKLVPDPTSVHQRLMARSVNISRAQVERVYETYGLKKTAG